MEETHARGHLGPGSWAPRWESTLRCVAGFAWACSTRWWRRNSRCGGVAESGPYEGAGVIASRARSVIRVDQRGLGRKQGALGDASGGAALLILDPRPRKVEFRSISACPRGGIGEVYRHLGVLHPARRTGVLPLHPCRGGALLDIRRLIHHQCRLRVIEVLYPHRPQIIPNAVRHRRCPRQQVLHPAQRRITGVLGYRPAVLARPPSQQAQHERPRPRRGSTLTNRPPIRSIRSSSMPSHRPGSALWPAATASHHVSAQTVIIGRWPPYVQASRLAGNDLLLEH